METSELTGAQLAIGLIRPRRQMENEASESAQRERMRLRFKARANSPATADFDLPAPNDIIIIDESPQQPENDANENK